MRPQTNRRWTEKSVKNGNFFSREYKRRLKPCNMHLHRVMVSVKTCCDNDASQTLTFVYLPFKLIEHLCYTRVASKAAPILSFTSMLSKGWIGFYAIPLVIVHGHYRKFAYSSDSRFQCKQSNPHSSTNCIIPFKIEKKKHLNWKVCAESREFRKVVCQPNKIILSGLYVW